MRCERTAEADGCCEIEYMLEGLLREPAVAAPATLARQIHLLIEGAIVSAHTFGDPVAATQARDAALALVAAGSRA